MTGYILSFFLFVFWLVSIFALRAYIKKRSGREVLLAELTDEVRGLETELNRITERDASLVEERVAALQKLLEAADEKTALFKAVIDEMIEQQNALKTERAKTEQEKKELEALQKAYGEKPLSAKIADLQKRGFGIDQIARKLEKTVTEIELSIAIQD
ncbi:MAG: hypothetical protein LBG27_07835 [Spirochaetaceae bacterium]|jgi:chromosome segregation ATPase|nr:hypothetical protein [Spirochaetaceae bacterium]